MQLQHNSATKFLDIYPREMKIYIHTKTSTAIFVMSRTRNNPDVLQQLIFTKLHYIHIMNYYSAIKRKGLWIPVKTCMNESPENYAE